MPKKLKIIYTSSWSIARKALFKNTSKRKENLIKKKPFRYSNKLQKACGCLLLAKYSIEI